MAAEVGGARSWGKRKRTTRYAVVCGVALGVAACLGAWRTSDQRAGRAGGRQSVAVPADAPTIGAIAAIAAVSPTSTAQAAATVTVYIVGSEEEAHALRAKVEDLAPLDWRYQVVVVPAGEAARPALRGLGYMNDGRDQLGLPPVEVFDLRAP